MGVTEGGLLVSGEDKSHLFKTLNECTALLNEDVAVGQSNMYVTMDRGRYNELLRSITEAKRLLVKSVTGEFYNE